MKTLTKEELRRLAEVYNRDNLKARIRTIGTALLCEVKNDKQ